MYEQCVNVKPQTLLPTQRREMARGPITRATCWFGALVGVAGGSYYGASRVYTCRICRKLNVSVPVGFAITHSAKASGGLSKPLFMMCRNK